MNCQNFRYKRLTKECTNELKKELRLQAEKIMSSGIRHSHFDSHHHIHTGPSFFPLFCSIGREYGIHKMRRMSNIESKSIKQTFRDLLSMYYNHLAKGYQQTDYFGSVSIFLDILQNHTRQYNSNSTIELMCHPGGHSINCEYEINILKEHIIDNYIKGEYIKYENI